MSAHLPTDNVGSWQMCQYDRSEESSEARQAVLSQLYMTTRTELKNVDKLQNKREDGEGRWFRF